MSDDQSDDKKQVEIFKSHSKFMKAKVKENLIIRKQIYIYIIFYLVEYYNKLAIA